MDAFDRTSRCASDTQSSRRWRRRQQFFDVSFWVGLHLPELELQEEAA
jgi:hypothetical protein